MTDTATLTIRFGRREDVPAVVAMLADDELGATRETATDPLPDVYWQAWEAIAEDRNNHLIVAELEGRVVGCLQLIFIPGLSLRGSWRAEVEGVRVARDVRGLRIGEKMMAWAEERARGRGCRLMQLTTNRAREDARRFYERLGFTASHAGMKKSLD